MSKSMKERFEQFEDDYIQFKDIENPAHPRPDICAFIMLDLLAPNPGRDMVCSAEHDEIWLDVDEEKLASASDEFILDLIRCGVRWDNSIECLCMYA